MLRFVAVLATLAAVNGFSVYSLPECLNPIDLSVCNQAPVCPPQLPCVPAPGQTVCVPGGQTPNSNAIIALLAALKSGGFIPDPNAPPANEDKTLLLLKLLNILSLRLGLIGGGGDGTPGVPGNGTLPLPGTDGGLLGQLLGALLGGATSPPSSQIPANFPSIILSLITSLATQPGGIGGCPPGSVPITCPPRCP